MLKIKRIYSYIIQSFFPVFLMTFFICLFIVLMQFLWKYVEDMVGKGLDNSVLAELFFFAALTLIPLALPLAILLASLMTFGNLGERLELLAIKAAGISLFKAMRPLIVFISILCVGVFFFQDDVMPKVNVKVRSLIISIRQKSPELSIPEGAFYSGIERHNIYVKKKNPKTGMLYDVIIYDVSKGFDNMSVYVSDSALMKVSDAQDHIMFTLYNGQHFSSFKNSNLDNKQPASKQKERAPYLKESFSKKAMIIAFDSSFDRKDESIFEGSQIAKNSKELRHSIDSMQTDLDSINIFDRRRIVQQTYQRPSINVPNYYNENETRKTEIEDSIRILRYESKKSIAKLDFDSLLSTYNDDALIQLYSSASNTAETYKSNTMFEATDKTRLQLRIRLHEIEWHRKFALSFACLIFFFIGAPLGAIIRKGGLGLPVVISVILFIIYYVIDNVGYKMARDGVWHIWQGMWISSAILFPLGVFLSYKAMNDSELFNLESYTKFYKKLFRKKNK